MLNNEEKTVLLDECCMNGETVKQYIDSATMSQSQSQSKEAQFFVQHGGRNAGKTKQMIQELRPDLDVYVYSGFTDEERELIINSLNGYCVELYFNLELGGNKLSKELIEKTQKEIDKTKNLLEKLKGEKI